MTRSKEQEIVPLDKEIDKTLRALRKEMRGEGTSTSIPLLQVPFEHSSHTTSRHLHLILVITSAYLILRLY